MSSLKINQHSKAALDLAALGLKVTADNGVKAANTATAVSGFGTSVRNAAEAKKANAHDALAALARAVPVRSAYAAATEANVLHDDEVEIRVGNRTIRLIVE